MLHSVSHVEWSLTVLEGKEIRWQFPDEEQSKIFCVKS